MGMQQMEAVRERLNSIDRRLEGLDVRFNWLIGIIVATWITTILTIILHH
jgi:hypothetical protein